MFEVLRICCCVLCCVCCRRRCAFEGNMLWGPIPHRMYVTCRLSFMQPSCACVLRDPTPWNILLVIARVNQVKLSLCADSTHTWMCRYHVVADNVCVLLFSSHAPLKPYREHTDQRRDAMIDEAEAMVLPAYMLCVS
jgi:hypothetical protein